jgi:predicted metal-dependent HD superfamily phosphohydrolase
MSASTDKFRGRLETAWRDLLQPFAVPEAAGAAAFADLASRYSEPSRHYHNLDHLAEVLGIIDGLTDEAADVGAVRWAAWLHDAVYNSQAKDNEERSAVLAEETLRHFGLPQPLVVNVGRLILLTKTHAADADDRDGHVLLDADLAILGAGGARYDEYAGAIRREYAWVEEAAYRQGRGQVLEGFLRRPRIYLTDALFASHEGPARHNLRRELAALRAGVILGAAARLPDS